MLNIVYVSTYLVCVTASITARFFITAYVAVNVLTAYTIGNVYFFAWATVNTLSVRCLSCSKLCFIATVLLPMSHRTNKVID